MNTPLSPSTTNRAGQITVGIPFHRWTVIEVCPREKGQPAKYVCRCECGTIRSVKGYILKAGESKSCGCLHKEITSKGKFHTTHGKENTKIYGIYRTMLTRCYNPNSKKFTSYGARGIAVSDDWRTFEAFYRDMGDPPAGMSLDRIDNDGPYSKANCRWATGKEQCNNTRRNVIISHNGKIQTVSQWAEEMKVDCRLIHARLKNGWSAERAIFEPARKGKYNQEKRINA